MSNYPDDVRQYDNDPRSPFYNGTTVEEDMRTAFETFITLDNEGHQLDILCESIVEREDVQVKLMEAISNEDRGLIGQIILNAVEDYAHDCQTGGTL